MKGRSRTAGKTVKERARTALEPRRNNPPKTVRGRSSSAGNAKSEVARLSRELNEALERATATAEVLTVINSSPGDLTPVFDVIAKRAMRLCDATFGGVWLIDGDRVRVVAAINVPKPFAEFLTHETQPLAEVFGRRTDRPFLHVVDLKATKAYQRRVPITVAMVELSKARTFLGVPLYRNRSPIGIIGLHRDEVHPFTDKQIELVQNFAAQAVIAIENARLLNELRQSLEQQTATADVLRVISSSPGELEPVFNAMLANAVRICAAGFGSLILLEGDAYRRAALYNAPAAYVEQQTKDPVRPLSESPTLTSVAKTKEVVQVTDIRAEHPEEAIAKFGGARTVLCVPMIRDDRAAGVFTIYRQEVRPFIDKQIALVQNFAAQAVIAIENARLLNELRESLQQQTATADVLKVISRSTFDLQAVLNTLVESAARLCEAYDATIWQPGGKRLLLLAHHGPIRVESLPLVRGTAAGRAFLDAQTVHITDLQSEVREYPESSKNARRWGFHTILCVPLMREGVAIGTVALRRTEAQPFTERQVALLQTFADQAVIAIENVRLFEAEQQRTRELTESLERQTATTEVLRVISNSPGDVQSVFHAMLENGVRACGAKFGVLFRYENSMFQPTAMLDVPPAFAEVLVRQGAFPPQPGQLFGRLCESKKVIQVEDRATEAHDSPSARYGGARSAIAVPMLKADELVGAFFIYRTEVQPFTDKQIELVQNFAAQAVIAIENARLLNELRESLEQQTATSEVLRVISSSPTDVQPVFDSIAESAVKLCDGQFSFVIRFDGKLMNFASCFGLTAEGLDVFRSIFPRPANDDTVSGRAISQRAVVEIPDVEVDAAYGVRRLASTVNYRSLVGVPLLHDGNPIGSIAVGRAHAGSFPERQIALLKAFADQAVIAIRNVRLFDELQERTADLSESLQQQTATGDVLKVISRSTFDLQTVLDTLTKSAAQLCAADRGVILMQDGEVFRVRAIHGFSREAEQYALEHPLLPGHGSVTGRVALEGKAVHIPDVMADSEYTLTDYQKAFGYRTVLGVPLLRDGATIGVFSVTRDKVNPFTDKQIELATTFADQAVIAIENARLLNELRQSLEQQTATAEVLRAISHSVGELKPVFETMLENATRICGATFGNLFLSEGDVFRAVAVHGPPSHHVEWWQREPIVDLRNVHPQVPLAQVARTKALLHISDLWKEQAYRDRDSRVVALAESAGAHTILGVPLLKEDELIGVLFIYRQEVRPFTDKQVELVQNFAAQAVIAIENARLLNELRQSLQQQTATADVLKVISRSAFNLQTVLDTLVESAARLCDADSAAIHRPVGNSYPYVASYGYSQEYHEYMRARPIIPGRGTILGRAVTECKPIQVSDVEADPEYTLQEGRRIAGFRTVLGIPLLREGVPIGVIMLTRNAVHSFTDKQIELATTFADQAAIAIENVRLFEAEQQRTQELAKSLEDLRATQDRLVQTQKLASLGQLTAGIAHEIKNPLNFVNNFSGVSVELIDELQNALGGITFDAKAYNEITELAKTLRENLDKIVQHGKRADSIVKNMLLHSREGSGEQRPVEINALVEESLNLAYHGARAEKPGFNITIERSFDRDVGQANLYPQEISRVLLNLISNGFYAATKRQREIQAGYEPTLAAATKNLGDHVEIRIRDNGTGIPLEVKEKMFNPFFTTKPAGEGTGLGLSISHDIVVKQHGGTIEVDSEPGEFTEIRIVLPRTAAFSATSGG